MHWLYRFFWLRTTFRAAFKSQFLAWLRLSLRRGKLGHVSAPRNTGSGSPLRPWAPTFPRLSLTLPPHFLQSTNHSTGTHISYSLVTCLPVSLDCHLGKGRNWLSVLCAPRAGVGPGSPPAPGRVTEGPCGDPLFPLECSRHTECCLRTRPPRLGLPRTRAARGKQS